MHQRSAAEELCGGRKNWSTSWPNLASWSVIHSEGLKYRSPSQVCHILRCARAICLSSLKMQRTQLQSKLPSQNPPCSFPALLWKSLTPFWLEMCWNPRLPWDQYCLWFPHCDLLHRFFFFFHLIFASFSEMFPFVLVLYRTKYKEVPGIYWGLSVPVEK